MLATIQRQIARAFSRSLDADDARCLARLQMFAVAEVSVAPACALMWANLAGSLEAMPQKWPEWDFAVSGTTLVMYWAGSSPPRGLGHIAP